MENNPTPNVVDASYDYALDALQAAKVILPDGEPLSFVTLLSTLAEVPRMVQRQPLPEGRHAARITFERTGEKVDGIEILSMTIAICAGPPER